MERFNHCIFKITKNNVNNTLSVLIYLWCMNLQVKVIHNEIWKHFCHISEIGTNLKAYIQTTGSTCIIKRKIIFQKCMKRKIQKLCISFGRHWRCDTVLAFMMQGTLSFASFVLFVWYSEMSTLCSTSGSRDIGQYGTQFWWLHESDGGQKNCNTISVTKVLLSLL